MGTNAAKEIARRINIFINDNRFEATSEEMSGTELMALGGVAEGNQLFLETPGPDDDLPVQPAQVVRLRSGMRFYDVPVGNFG